jgi:hypothetical protein
MWNKSKSRVKNSSHRAQDGQWCEQLSAEHEKIEGQCEVGDAVPAELQQGWKRCQWVVAALKPDDDGDLRRVR